MQEIQIDTDSLQTIPDFKPSRRNEKRGEPPILLPFGQYMKEVEANNENINGQRNFQPGFYLYTVNADDTSLPVKDLSA